MISVEEAVARILVDVPRMAPEEVALVGAFDRVLAADLVATMDVPSFHNSAMDGYAVRAIDTLGAARASPVRLRLRETVGAGTMPSETLAPGEAAPIMTGAPMPSGADAVVMQEDTDGARSGAVQIYLATASGRHVRERGSDVRAGAVVLSAGARLTPSRVGVIASLGRPVVAVSRRPVVAILSTGDELVQPGQPLRPGQIYSSNNISLSGMVAQAGGSARDHGSALDTLEATVEALERAIHGADAVVTTGGVSVGAFDYVKDAFAQVRADVDFWRVRMKPGKPLIFGRVTREGRSIPLFGLPGNPVSCLVNFAQFVRPWIRMALGDPRPFLPVISAIARDDLRESPGRARLLRVRLQVSPEGVEVRSAGSQSSGALSGMAGAHGLLLVGVDDEGPAPGASCRVQVLDPGFADGADPDYGW